MESEFLLHSDMFYKIMVSGLETSDVVRCMQVSKLWKVQLSDQHFWKEFVKAHFDLTATNEFEEGPLYQWFHPDIWACYFENREDPYVIRPFPYLWKCGVVVPHGLDPMSLDTKHLQSLCKSLEILIRIKRGVKEFGLDCGNECSGNEGSNSLSVVLMPWEGGEILPDKLTVFSQIFQFHHEIWEDQLDVYSMRFDEKIYFHLDEHPRGDRKKPCLNKVFGRAGTYFWEHHKYDYEKELAFFTWLQKIMVPSRRYIAGEMKMNPVAEFFITTLAPGWVGGILTGETWT